MENILFEKNLLTNWKENNIIITVTVPIIVFRGVFYDKKESSERSNSAVSDAAL
jgi:hypothetical protein